MKNNNPLKTILEAAGRPANITNRSFYTKASNAALNTGLVTIEVMKNGMVWTNPTNHNLRVKAAGYIRRVYIRGEMTPNEILRSIGALLLDERVKAEIKSYVHLRSSDCHKCQGVGVIPHFHYYCSGICFNCGGTGWNLTNEKTIVKITE